jgi:hypothetical protein
MMASSGASFRGGPAPGAPQPANEKAKTDALQHMDLAKIMRGYILGIVNAAQGYKALIVDKDTMRVASSLLGRTELGEHNIVLVERLEAQAQGKHHEELKVGLGNRHDAHAAPCSSLALPVLGYKRLS